MSDYNHVQLSIFKLLTAIFRITNSLFWNSFSQQFHDQPNMHMIYQQNILNKQSQTRYISLKRARKHLPEFLCIYWRLHWSRCTWI